MEVTMGYVIALAGRRIDPSDAKTARFPLVNVPVVREQLTALFVEVQPSALVCSAACGADLLALEAARAQGLRCRIVLPFDRTRFRESSVTDRPGNWGPLFDRMMDAAVTVGDLVVLEADDGEERAYAAANEAILREAQALAEPSASAIARGSHPGAVLAVLVWDGRARGADDLTASFAAAARRCGMATREVATVSQEAC
jgi:hypothetical protein